MKLISLLACFLTFTLTGPAQTRNYIKLSAMDCANCVKAVDYLVSKDPQIKIVLDTEFASDSLDLIDKFGLKPFRNHIVWDKLLYDSLSRTFESELVQYLGNKEVNRSGLRDLHFVELNASADGKLCLADLSDHIMFRDYKYQLVITNYLSQRQYVYSKSSGTLREIAADSNLIRSLYIDRLNNEKMYRHYAYEAKTNTQLAPKITSLMPYNDTTLVGALKTYMAAFNKQGDTILTPFISLVFVPADGKSNKVMSINNVLPVKEHMFSGKAISSNGKVYLQIGYDKTYEDTGSKLQNLALISKESDRFVFKEYLPVSNADYPYLKSKKIYSSSHYMDNGFYLMSLGNYVMDLATFKKYPIPFDDSLYQNAHFTNSNGMSFFIWDFKYDIKTHTISLLYKNAGKMHLASFKPGDKKFNADSSLYTIDSEFGKSLKNICFSWDARKIVYCFKNDNCFRAVTPEEFRKIAGNPLSVSE
jgi:hypothetical protein